MNPTGLRKNSPLKVFSFSQRDTILTGKAVCLNKKPTAKSTKGQKQISAILEKKEAKFTSGIKVPYRSSEHILQFRSTLYGNDKCLEEG